MPRVHKVEKARKAIPSSGVKVGDTYYWWTFKNRVGKGTRMTSKTYPKPSQLTRSSFKSAWRSFSEEIEELALDDGLYDALQEIAGRIRELGEEAQGSLDNMPEGLQQGATGELLQTRIDNCESWASDIEGLDDPGSFDEAEIEDLPEFGAWLDEGGPSGPMPASLDDGLQEWAEKAWSDFGDDLQAKIEEARTEYDSKLEELRDEAINADPGEE